jgi:hypothetical protein
VLSGAVHVVEGLLESSNWNVTFFKAECENYIFSVLSATREVENNKCDSTRKINQKLKTKKMLFVN